ncbi:MAG: uroporphyrinogen-III C-methyltransferase [Burkholderiales bacterium]|nr:uroporphyrinogen-III C-methyltransferase [Burkholderiales bacterium]MDE2564811.1 uroporphyrinogen-III C-methyltransferase [Burkholderiales bacterium]
MKAARRPRPWCALVGAGPGDPELLTLKALRVMRRATLLLVDDLVSDAVLERALRGRRAPPRVVHVGKRGGCRSTPQAFIERLMVSQALAGERVVRLKGGDPLVFGRGGEEAQALQRHGIEVEIVNGITAGLAAATDLGVPWTHRDHAQGAIVVTAHAREGGRGPDWPTLAAAAAQGLTLVIYMGMSRLAAIQTGLLVGLAPHTPAALVEHAGLPHSRSRLTTLGSLLADAQDLGSPGIVIVGPVLQAAAARAGRGRARAA